MHQNVNKQKRRAERTVYGPIISLFYVIVVSFFFFFVQDANKPESKCPIKRYNLSKTHELALNKTQSRESNYLDHKLLKNF